MANLLSYDAILFPADGRTPHLVTLSASPVTEMDVQTGQLVLISVLPHPEVHMDLIADNNNRATRAWRFQMLKTLDGMTRGFANPYIIFYPVLPRDGSSFPLNKSIEEIQGRAARDLARTWRGNILVAKYRGGGADPFMTLMDISMADFPLLKNYLSGHGPDGQDTGSPRNAVL